MALRKARREAKADPERLAIAARGREEVAGR